MKFMIIGGITSRENEKSDKEVLSNYCKKIGQTLRELNHSLVLCSPMDDSADYWTYLGYIEGENEREGSVDFYYVDTPEVRNEVEQLRKKADWKCKFQAIPSKIPINDELKVSKYDWLLCQLKSIEDCNIVISLGGKAGGSAELLLSLAEDKRKLVLPFTIMDGVALQAYTRRRYELMDKLGKKLCTIR